MAKKVIDIKVQDLRTTINGLFHHGYIDNHDGKEKMADVAIIRIADDGKQMNVCFASDKAQYFSINPFDFDYDEGKVHLLQGSIGGVVDCRRVDFKQALRDYEANHEDEEIFLIRKDKPEFTNYVLSRISEVFAA